MRPNEAVDYLCQVYGGRRLTGPMRAFYEAAFTGLAADVAAQCVLAICEQHRQLPTVKVVRDVIASVRPRRLVTTRPREADSAFYQWLRTPVLGPEDHRTHMRHALRLCQRIIAEQWGPAQRLEAFAAMKRRWPSCNWDEAIEETERQVRAAQPATTGVAATEG